MVLVIPLCQSLSECLLRASSSSWVHGRRLLGRAATRLAFTSAGWRWAWCLPRPLWVLNRDPQKQR